MGVCVCLAEPIQTKCIIYLDVHLHMFHACKHMMGGITIATTVGWLQ